VRRLSFFGLLATGFAVGLVATALMSLAEVPYWIWWKITGVLEWHENQVIWNRLTGKPSSAMPYLGIFCLHFLNGGLAAIPFPFIGEILPMLAWVPLPLLGVVYGCILWLLTLVLIHKPVTGVSITQHPLGSGPVAASLVGHVLYGASLGILNQLI
jgi:hypothetical protein